MKKKTLTLLLALAMSAPLLAGCGNTAERVDSDSVVVDKPQTDDTTEVDDAGEDAPIMSEADEASDASSDESTDEAEADNKREQGSIGESGLPYYEIGFFPNDFTIDGFDVYSIESAEGIYYAVNLPDYYELSQSDVHMFSGHNSGGFSLPERNHDLVNSGDYGWYKGLWDDGRETGFTLHVPDGQFTFVTYRTGADGTSINFGKMKGHTIAEADFIQSPIIPGETTLSEAMEALGIRDLFEATGHGSNYFESQFSEENKFYRDGDDSWITLDWHDEYGNLVHLEMQSRDVVDRLVIQIY